MKSSSRLLRVLFGLKVLLIYHIIVINCAPKDRGTSESSRVESWINYLLSETGISSHSLGRYFGLKGTVHIARMGPTSSKLNGRKYVGFVPWAKQFDMDIDGIYEIEGDMIFKKLSSHEHNKIEDNEDKHEEDNTKTKTIIKFLHHENSFRFEERDSESSDLIREKEVEVFGALGPFTLYQCSMGRLNIIWDKEEKVEIARLLCGIVFYFSIIHILYDLCYIYIYIIFEYISKQYKANIVWWICVCVFTIRQWFSNHHKVFL